MDRCTFLTGFAAASAAVPEVCRAAIREVDSVSPRPSEAGVYDRSHTVYRALYPALKPLYGRIEKL